MTDVSVEGLELSDIGKSMISGFQTRKRNKQRASSRRRARLGFETLDSRRVLAGITGFVFDDLDSSGLQDPGENGLQQRVVYIDTNSNKLVDFGEPIQLTEADGSFQFQNLDPGTYNVRLYNGTLSQALTNPLNNLPHTVILSAPDQTAQVAFGLRVDGVNNAPTSSNVNYSIDEDTSFIVRPTPTTNIPKDLLDYGSDVDRFLGDADMFIAIQTSQSENGTIEIHPNGGFRYRSAEDFSGQDKATYVLHDGRAASAPVTATVDVRPVNDSPRGIEFDGDTLPENSPPGTVVGAIHVLDPDFGDVFEIEVFDGRFVVQENLLILAPNALIDFEDGNEKIVIDVQAANPENDDLILGQITINVGNVDDPATSISFDLPKPLTEGVPGLDVGTVRIEDQDGGQHSVTVNDDRFEVVFEDGVGTLRLVGDAVLDFAEDHGSVITLTLHDSANRGAPLTHDVTLQVNNVNDSPTAINLDREIVLERVLGARVGALTVVDPDPHDTHTIDVFGGDEHFEVTPEGVLKLKDNLFLQYDPEGPVEQLITLQIMATDNAETPLSVTEEFTIPIIRNHSPWQNRSVSNDVDNDGSVEPQDALIILNALNEGGPRPLDTPFHGSHFIDVNGDGLLTPLDALIIVNSLNTIVLGSSADSTPVGEGEQASSTNRSVAPKGDSKGQEQPAQMSAIGLSPEPSEPVFADDEDWLLLSLDEPGI